MTENFEPDAHDYLLHQMDAARRAAFERQLETSAEARAALKACADSLAHFAAHVAPAEPLGAADHRAAFGAITAATQSPGVAASAKSPRTSRLHLLWPAAALLLLALNLIQFERPFVPNVRPADSPIAEKGVTPASTVPGANDRPASLTDPGSAPLPPTTPIRNASANPNDSAREIARLRSELADLQRIEQKVRLDYEALLERFSDRTVVERQLNRLTTMELVDAASYARGERKGLVNVGRGVLTAPGIVVPSEPPPPLDPTASTMRPPAYAWSVYDEKENRGYLNLYRLPSLPADQSMQVWVKPAESKDYQRVGEVPREFQGGNGAVQYTLPPATSAPAEILITIEPRNTQPSTPTGPTVLKGP